LQIFLEPADPQNQEWEFEVICLTSGISLGGGTTLDELFSLPPPANKFTWIIALSLMLGNTTREGTRIARDGNSYSWSQFALHYKEAKHCLQQWRIAGLRTYHVGVQVTHKSSIKSNAYHIEDAEQQFCDIIRTDLGCEIEQFSKLQSTCLWWLESRPSQLDPGTEPSKGLV
jgi:hypothetical protein